LKQTHGGAGSAAFFWSTHPLNARVKGDQPEVYEIVEVTRTL
jgi:hypothetical protein